MTRDQKIKALVEERYSILKMLDRVDKKLATLRGGGNVEVSEIERPDVELLKHG